MSSKKMLTLRFQGGPRDGLEIYWPAPEFNVDLLDHLPGQLEMSEVLRSKVERLANGQIKSDYVRRKVLYALEPPEAWEAVLPLSADDYGSTSEWCPIKDQAIGKVRPVSKLVYVYLETTDLELPSQIGPDWRKLWDQTDPASEEPDNG